MSKRFYAEEQPQLDTCPIYGGMCGYPSNLCYECPRHEGAKEQPQWWTEGLQPFAQPQLDTEFAEAVRAMFADIWDREIDHPRFQDTVGEILEKVIELHNSVPPMKLDEWCESCKEYDQTTHSCPRFNRVIRTTLDDVRKDAMAHQWIPVSERLPEDSDYHDLWETPYGAVMWCKGTGEIGAGWYYESTKTWCDLWDNGVKDVIAWMPLPEPYKGEQKG